MTDKGGEGKLDCWGNFIETILTFNTRVWARYGNFVGTPVGAIIMFLFGSAIVTGLAVGIIQVEYENNLDNLWVEKGSRAADERDLYNEYFGGPGRLNLLGYTLTADKGKEDLQPSNETDHGILTKEAVYGFMNSTKDLLFESGVNYVTKNLTLTGGASSLVNFTWSDFCSRPTLPSVALPWTPVPGFTTPSLPTYANYVKFNFGSAINQKRQISAGFFFMSTCLASTAFQKAMSYNTTTISVPDYVQLQMWMQNTARVDEILALPVGALRAQAVLTDRPGLSAGWGIDRAPCTRSLVADAFSNGDFDYPAGLKALNEYGFSFTALSTLNTTESKFRGVLLGGMSWYDNCLTSLNTSVYMGTLSQPGATVANATANAALMNTYITSLFPTYSGAGYWWRPSIEEVSSIPNFFAQYVINSINNALTNDKTVCVGTGMTRKMLGFKKMAQFPAAGANLLISDAATRGYLSVPSGCLVNWALRNMTTPLYIGGLNPSDPVNTTAVRASKYFYAAALRMSNSGFSTSFKFLLDRLKNEKSLETALTSDEATEIVREVEQMMIDKLSDMRDKVNGTGYGTGEPYNQFEIYFLMDRSTGDLFDEAAQIEGPLLIGGYLALICFSSFNFILFRCPPNADGWVYSRALLIFSGLCTVGGAIAASFGFCGWVGLKLSPVNSTLIPFLAMGLGTGDIFVLVHELYRHKEHQDNPRERITVTMADAGSSVLVSCWANIAAFLIPGGVVKLPAIYTFSLQMGICIILSWTTAMTMFVPVMTLNAYQTAKRGMCCKAPESEVDTRAISLDAVWVWFAERLLVPLYSNLFFRIFMIAGFIAMTTILAIWGFQYTENGLLLSDVVVKSHYAYDYLKLQENYFDLMPGSIVTRHINYTDTNGKAITFPEYQANVLHVLADTANTDYIDKLNSPTSGYFLPSLIAFFNDHSGLSIKFDTIPPALFYPTLQTFLATTGSSFSSDLVCRNMTSLDLVDCSAADGTSVRLEVTSGAAYFSGMEDDSDYVDAIKIIRKDTDHSVGNKYADNSTIKPVPVFYAGSLFKYWQQYVTIENTAYKTVGFSLLGVFLITTITQASPLSSILVGVMLFATVLQLYGFMAILGIKLNGWSATNLGVCVGMSVQTTAYYSYAFLRAHADTPDRVERMQRALVEMFPPLLDGAITSLVSVIVLAFAKFPFFRLYFFVMIGVMIALSFLNGVVFLPCILSFIAPRGLDRAHRAISIASPDHLPAKDGLDNNRL